VRCLYCGKKLALLRKLTDSEFCSGTHRRLYQQEQEKMALARLVDAQQKSSRFHGSLQAPGKLKVNGALQGPHACAQDRAYTQGRAYTQDEEERGFVEHLPRLQALTGGRRDLAVFPKPIVNDPAIPTYEALLKTEPRMATHLAPDIPAFTRSLRALYSVEPQFEPSWTTLIPASRLALAQSISLTQSSATKEQTDELEQAALEAGLPAEDPVGSVSMNWAWEPRSAQLPSLRSVEAGTEPFPAPALSPPAFPAPVSALAGLAQGCEAQLGWMAGTVESICQPMAFGPVLLAGTPQGLELLGKSLAPAGFPCATPVDVQIGDAAAERLVPAESANPAGPALSPAQGPGGQSREPERDLDSPQAAMWPIRLRAPQNGLFQDLPMRKPRVREVFFPLPKVGSLPEMATRLWRAARANRHDFLPESLPLCWIVSAVHEPEPRAFETLPWKELAVRYWLLASTPQFHPRLGPATAFSRGLDRGGPTELFPSAGRGAGSLLTKQVPADWAATGMVSVTPRTPRSRVNLSVRLNFVDCQIAAEPVSKATDIAMKRLDMLSAAQELPAVLATPEPRLPEARFAWRECRIGCSQAMASVPVASHTTPMLPLAAQDLDPYPADRESIPIVCPVSHVTQDFQPAESHDLVMLGASSVSAVALAQLGPTYKDLKSLWPEPVRQMPRMRTSVVEDPTVREAVRSIPVSKEKGGTRRPGVSLPKLPSLPAIQFARLPDWKWAMFLVPAVFLVSLISVFTPDSAEQVASNDEPAAMETSAQEPAAVSPDPGTLAASAGKRAEPAPAPQRSEGSSPAPVAEVLAAPLDHSKPGKANFLAASLNNLRQTLLKRAAVSFSDDFRSGLAEWEGKGDWSKQWSYDNAGFVRTGPLALYRPSMTLTDYDMNLLGQIEKKSIGWVYRARDMDNYYAMKITLTRGGPLPEAVVERYAVIQGKQSSYERRPLPLQVRTDTVYPISMNVKGDDFTLRVQGQVVDYWSDSRLKSGGVGLFSAKGEQARIRWIEVSHQYDTLGKLCAFLAPYSLPAR
jgi:hypothetical protein